MLTSNTRAVEIEVYLDGDSWCALVGENIQSGQCFFADTKEAARDGLLRILESNRKLN